MTMARLQDAARRPVVSARPDHHGPLRRLAGRVVLSAGWGRRLIACAAGAVGALAMAPFDVLPAMVVPLTVGVWLLDGCTTGDAGARRAFRRGRLGALLAAADAGWWLGLGYFVAGLWWLGSAFLAEADKFVWLLPFGVLGLPAYLALFTALGFMVARAFWCTGPARVLVFAVALAGGEWLRGIVLTGFPWNDIGMALGGNLLLGQAARLVGLHGLTLVAALIGAAPATLADGGRTWRRFAPPGLAIALLGAVAGYGAVELAGPTPADVVGVRLRVMQPNTLIDERFSYTNRDAIVRHYLELSDRATSPTTTGLADVTHLIWPESAFPFILSRNAEALSTIGAALPPTTTLVTGAARLEPGPLDASGKPVPLYFNAIQVVGSGGSIIDSYDKVHLVPFGEFLPMEGLLESLGVTRFVDVPGGFQSGTIRRSLTVPGLPPVAPVVCYEAIFSGEVVPDQDRTGRNRPGLLLNVTNDAWFGFTPGPSQHFAQARLRAIEEALPLVRSASTGISAVVDARGRVRASLPVGAENVIDATLPAALPPPLFARYGNRVPAVLLLIAGVAALLMRRLPLGKFSS